MSELWPLDMLVGAARALQEEVAGGAVRRQARGLTCLPGCNHCCHWPVAVSVLEGLILVDWLKHNRMWAKGLQDKVRASADLVTNLAYDVWRCANMPCPMLAANGMCQVWPVRPIVCRLAASTGEPSECHPHTLPLAQGIVPITVDLMEYRLREGVLLRVHGIKAATMPLATAVLVADLIRRKNLTLHQVDAAVFIEYIRRAM